MTSDYKKYSLEKLQDWVHDAMNSDASPHEIYSAIRYLLTPEADSVTGANLVLSRGWNL